MCHEKNVLRFLRKLDKMKKIVMLEENPVFTEEMEYLQLNEVERSLFSNRFLFIGQTVLVNDEEKRIYGFAPISKRKLFTGSVNQIDFDYWEDSTRIILFTDNTWTEIGEIDLI